MQQGATEMIDRSIMPYDPAWHVAVGDTRPTILVISDDSSSISAQIDANEMRLLACVTMETAPAHLDRLAQADMILFAACANNLAFPALAERLARMATEQEAALIVTCDLPDIDGVFAAFSSCPAQILCDPSPMDVVAAFALAIGERQKGARFEDVGRESEATRIERLSAEVGRIARALDSLMRGEAAQREDFLSSTGMQSHIADRTNSFASEPAFSGEYGASAPLIESGQIRELLRARRQRDQYLPAELFADPAWDMMLDLMAARLADERVSVSSLCIAAAVPPTTALRWIKQLTDRGFFVRQADPVDGRRVFIALSDNAAEAVARWFAAVRAPLRDAVT